MFNTQIYLNSEENTEGHPQVKEKTTTIERRIVISHNKRDSKIQN